LGPGSVNGCTGSGLPLFAHDILPPSAIQTRITLRENPVAEEFASRSYPRIGDRYGLVFEREANPVEGSLLDSPAHDCLGVETPECNSIGGFIGKQGLV
jgi:hypothetical protein